MLIKDPYLSSEIKNRSFSSMQPKNVNEFTQKQPLSKNQYVSQPYKKGEQINKKDPIYTYERQVRSLSEAYRNQEQAIRKMTSVQYISRQYNQAIKQRNYQLNAKLSGLAYEKSLMAQKHQEQIIRNTYDKDLILKKYEEQNEQIIRLKRSNAELLQQKARLQSQIDHLMFLLQKDNHQGSLEIKEQIIRMENMERTLRGIIDTKDAQLIQLRHRLKVYEDENKRLNDLNKTLTITRQEKIDNLSNISHMDSNIKSHNKENIDLNRRDDFLIAELNQQKQVNKQLLNEITLMKKKLFEEPSQNPNPKSIIQKKQTNQMQSDKFTQQKMARLVQIRRQINQMVYEIYTKSVRQGEREKKNSLLIFIQNYKKSATKQAFSMINQYNKIREELKNLYKSTQNILIRERIEDQLPIKLNSKKHSQDSEWVLSTMQLTKNQRNDFKDNQKEVSQSHNAILFLFRLLTIEFRTKNTIEAKVMHVQRDVENQLLHSIVKATQTLLQIA